MNELTKIFFAPEGSDKTPLMEAYVAVAKKVHGMIEKTLEHHGGKFAAGS